jgi:transcription factor C subunit 6
LDRRNGNEEDEMSDDDSATTIPLSEAIRSHQILKEIDYDELSTKHLLHNKPSHSVVLGPWGNPRQFDLPYLSPLDFGQAWRHEEDPSSSSQRHHQGWLLNVGEKVQDLAWCPCDTPVQYLAVAVRCTSGQRRAGVAASGQEERQSRPAFHPSPPYPSAIQIWAFQTDTTQFPGVRALSTTRKPNLAVVIATEWGNIRQIKWCPSTTAETDSSTMGVLGVRSSDGCARILAVPFPPLGTTPYCVKADRAGFTVGPTEGAISTALNFMTPTDLIVGGSDGSIRLFDLTQAQTPSDDDLPPHYFHHRLHTTYVVTVCPAAAPFATYVASTSAAGELVLTDLRSPTQDRAAVARACFPNRDLHYSRLTRSFVMAVDRAGNTKLDAHTATLVVCHHLRQFPHSVRVAKLPDRTGAATALAGSPWHPCVVVGNVRGQLFVSNHLRKVLPFRRNQPGRNLGAYLQKVCEYDWRPLELSRGREGEPAEKAEADAADEGNDGPARPELNESVPDLFHGSDVRPGVSRFHEGFEPDKIDVANVPTTAKTTDWGSAEPVFEEEHAVTAVAWNPNPAAAGLVAAGWGSGLVRIQDLAHDVG